MVARLIVENLALGYQGKAIVSNLDFELIPGELVAIIGMNGAGKSTLIKGLAGLMDPMCGRILLDSTPLSKIAVRERAKRVAVLPQVLRSLPGLGVEDFVTQGRYIHRPSWQRISAEDQRAVDAAILSSELEGLRGRTIDSLSGGERQRAIFARALAQSAEVLLVDEPTAALDGKHKLWAFRKLADLRHAGHTIALVTHDINLASQFADRIMIIEDGAIQSLGRPREVLQPRALEGLLGHEFLAGSGFSPYANEERPWFIPWWHGEDRAPEGQHHEDQNPNAE